MNRIIHCEFDVHLTIKPIRLIAAPPPLLALLRPDFECHRPSLKSEPPRRPNSDSSICDALHDTMPMVTRNTLYRKPVDFSRELPPERNPHSVIADLPVVYHIFSYLLPRDLKTVRLVNCFLANIGGKNSLWSELCRLKWSEKLCLQTIPMPALHTPDPDSEDDCQTQVEEETMSLHETLTSMDPP